jgi:5-methylcytosine-specific restriction endonuclease McrA
MIEVDLMSRYRAGFLAENHICLECERRGRINLATRVHHLRELQHPRERLTLENSAPLCTSCYCRRADKAAIAA